MPAALTSTQLAQRARVEIAKAWQAHSDTKQLGRTAGRTNRMRAAKSRAGKLLSRAVRRGLRVTEARKVYESSPPDPEYGKAEW